MNKMNELFVDPWSIKEHIEKQKREKQKSNRFDDFDQNDLTTFAIKEDSIYEQRNERY